MEPREEEEELYPEEAMVPVGAAGATSAWGAARHPLVTPTSVIIYGVVLLVLLLLLWICFESHNNQISKKQRDNDQKLLQVMQNQQALSQNQQAHAQALQRLQGSGMQVGGWKGDNSNAGPEAGDANGNGNGNGNGSGNSTCPNFGRRPNQLANQIQGPGPTNIVLTPQNGGPPTTISCDSNGCVLKPSSGSSSSTTTGCSSTQNQTNKKYLPALNQQNQVQMPSSPCNKWKAFSQSPISQAENNL